MSRRIVVTIDMIGTAIIPIISYGITLRTVTIIVNTKIDGFTGICSFARSW
jgi:hypothetical protein